jgi:hypothetical protein
MQILKLLFFDHRLIVCCSLGNDYKTDGTLDIPLDWVPGMKGMRLTDMPTFCRTTDADDWLLHFHVHQMRVVSSSKAVILNTFYDMEKDVVDALAKLLPPVYTVGPLSSIVAALSESGDTLGASDASLLQEDTKCMAWLDGKAACRLRRVRELRQPRQHGRHDAAGVCGRAGTMRVPVPMGPAAGHGCRRRGRRARACGVMVRAGGGVEAPGRGAVCVAMWVELYSRKR